MKTGEAKESSLSRDVASLAEMASDAVVAFDIRERITYWNPAAERMYGWTEQEALGKTPAELFWPAGTPQAQKNQKQRLSNLKQGEILRDEYETYRKDGLSLRVQYAVRAIFNEERKLTGYLAICRDISAQEALRASEDRYRVVIDNALDAIIVTNPSEAGRVLSANSAACRMFGYSQEQFIGLERKDILDVSDPRLAAVLERRSQLGQVLSTEVTYKRKDGTRFPGELSSALYQGGNGEQRAVAIIRDITERKQIETQLKDVAEKYATLFDSTSDGVWIHNLNGEILEVNDAYCRMSGYSRAELTHMSVGTVEAVETPREIADHIQKLIETGGHDRFESQHRRKDGSIFDVDITALYLEREGGRIAVFVRDITERKLAAAKLQASRQILETVVNHLPTPVALLRSSDLCLQLINPAYQAIAPGKEMIGRTLDELWTETGQNFTAICRRVLETGEPYQVVDELNMIRRRPDGPLEQAYFSWSLYRVQLPGDGGWGLLNTSWETTARKQAEETLSESEERLRQMIETSPVAIGFGNSSGKIFEANMAFYRLTGYSREEIETSQLGWHQLTAPEYAEVDRQILIELNATGSAGPYEKEYIRKDGSRVPLLLTVSKLPGRDEHIAFIMDMTERNRTRQQIFESNQRLMALMNALPVGVTFSDDPTCQQIIGNPAALAQFEMRSEDNISASASNSSAAGRQVRYFLNGRQITDADLPLQRAVAENREIPPMELEIHLPSGRRWWASASGAPVCDQNGKVIGGVAVTQDITAHKQVEEQLRGQQKQLQLLNETLEQKVQEKTVEVHRLASDVIQAVQHERHRISHILHDDLQQRIYAIQMQLTFLHDQFQKENEAAHKELSAVEQQLAEILSVTRHLSIDLSPPILRDEGLAHAINWLAVQMRQGYGLSIELRADESFAIPDEALHVLLFNCVRELLFNVVKHAQARRAEVSLQWIDAGLQIEVCDDGRGFPVNISEPQAVGEVSMENNGQSGLGLPTIRHQLDLFGGRMEIQSQPGKGACIILTVPVAEGG